MFTFVCLSLYKTVVERDWAYIAKREYRWDVEYKAFGNGLFAGNLAWSLRMFMLKKFVIWPLPVVGTLAYLYYKPLLLQKHNKKLFDMCNVGEQYTLGTFQFRLLYLPVFTRQKKE